MVTYTTTSPSHRDVPTRTETTGGAAEPTDALTAARAEALFASDVPMHSTLTRDEFRAAVRDALLRHHGVRGCAAEVAGAYGDCRRLRLRGCAGPGRSSGPCTASRSGVYPPPATGWVPLRGK